MGNIKNTEIPNIKTPWENYSGERVEEFIKKQLSTIDSVKFGYLAKEDGDNGLTTLRFFKDEASYQEWFGDKQRFESNVLKEFSFYSIKPKGSFTTRVTVNRYLSETMSKGSSNIFSLAYNCYWEDDPANKDTSNGLMTVSINGKEIPTLSKVLVASGSPIPNSYSVDLGEYLTEETNAVEIKVTNSQEYTRTYKFTVKVYALTLSFDETYDESVIQFGAWNLRVNCQGTEATVYCKVMNNGVPEIYTKTIRNSSGEFTIDPKNSYTFGAHDITLWAENTELGLRTPEITTTYIKGTATDRAVPALCFGKGIPNSAKQFSVLEVPYFFYLPQEESGQEAEVTITLLYDGGNKTRTLSSQIVKVSAQKHSGTQRVRIPLDNGNYLPSIKVKIGVGTLSIEKEIHIESIGVDVKDADECKVLYSMRGKSNGDKDAQNLVSTYDGKQTSRFIRSRNFQLDENNGFLDGYGITVRPGKTLTLEDYLPFSTDFGANGNKKGRTIELEFQSGVCSDENTIIIDCWDSGTGFRIFANRIEFACSADSVTTYFPEQTRIKVAFVIDGNTTHTKNDLGGGNVQEADANLAYLYVNGVIVRVFNYLTASWKQGTAKNIVIGSTEALVELYSLRIYDKALTFNQVVGNFAFDTPDVEDVYENGKFVRFGKVSIARRNDILNSVGDIHQPGEIISYTKVLKALPNTPIITWNIDNLPYNKNNPDLPINGTEFVNPQWDSKVDKDAMAPFVVSGHMFNADGTSSNGYPSPYKNWAEIFKTSTGESIQITLDPKNTSKNVTAYSITRGISEGETEMVHKVNFASSEGIFNIHAMNVFQEILLNCAKTEKGLLTKFQKEQFDRQEEITYRKSLSGFPEIGFRKTSQTGNAAPTFLSIYNFINNKYSASFMGFPKKDFKKAQIWEVDENVNFFNRMLTDNSLDGGKVVQSNATKKSGPIYYARVPKKSPTNKNNKLGQLKEPTDNVEASNMELAVIKRFHNWVVSCNYHLCERYKKQHGEYQLLSSPVTYNGTTYRYDNPEYRKAKFVNEHHLYIKKVDAIFYVIFCVYVIGMDSLDKNMSTAFDDIVMSPIGEVISALARLFLRDTDSRDLFNNSGVLTFKYWHEWNDAFNVATGKTLQITGEKYNSDTNSWEPEMEVGFSPVFNGRLSGLIDLIWTCWSTDIAAVYKMMRDNGLNAAYMFQRYLDFWKQWCENLYNADAMGYVNTGHFTKAYGDKLQLSKYFYEKRSRYLDSKFCCGDSIVNNLRLRLYEQGKGLALKHYSPMYAGVQWGANNFVSVRNIDGGYALIPFGFTNPQNATFDIDDADMLTDIKTYTQGLNGRVTYYGLEGLGNFYFDSNMALCTRLTEFIMDYSESAPNTLEQGVAFDLSKMTLLKKVIVRNVKNLKKIITLNTEVATEVNFAGSGIKGVRMLPNQYLRKLVLPESIEELYLTGFTNLQSGDLELAGISNVNKFVYYDCPNIDFATMLVKLAANGKLKFIEAKNIDLTITDKSVWDILINSNADLQGKITLSGFTLSFDDKVKAVEKWGNIDDNSNKLHIVYNIINCATVDISGDSYIQEVADSKYSIYATPISANNISSVSWSITENPYATINPKTGQLYVTKISSTKDDTSAKATIKADVIKSDGSVLKAEFEVGFYKRTPLVGDLVYADATISDKLNRFKDVIGLVYHITASGIVRIFTTYQPNARTDVDSVFMGPASSATMSNGSKINNFIPEDDNTLELVPNISPIYGYNINEPMPNGLRNTLQAISRRDAVILDKGKRKIDDFDDFNALTNEEEQKLYYLGFSKAFTFEPKLVYNKKLDSRFKKHKWYIPSIDELKELLTCIVESRTKDGGFKRYKTLWHEQVPTTSVYNVSSNFKNVDNIAIIPSNSIQGINNTYANRGNSLALAYKWYDESIIHIVTYIKI